MENQPFVEGNGILVQIERMNGIDTSATSREYEVSTSASTSASTFSVEDIERALEELINESPELITATFNFGKTRRNNNMEATDLMVGDYIKSSNTPLRVKQIREYNNNDYRVVVVDDDNMQFECYLWDINPIHITKAILDMNFSHTSEWWFQDDADIYLRIYPEEDEKYCLVIKHKGTHIRKKISYVHELQHCLQLCNYDKSVIV